MPLIFLAVIITVPYLEFLVFMKVGDEIGGFSALMLTILTAFLGIYIIR
ncbi:MAG: FxsA family protein, partial [Kordiimonadaceae bacterium]|nr:FxsA family protein [Kordiimonadaceae bacterium]